MSLQIDQATLAGIDTLESRQLRLIRLAKLSLLIGVSFLSIGVVVSFVARQLGPIDTLTSVDIPSLVTSAMERLEVGPLAMDPIQLISHQLAGFVAGPMAKIVALFILSIGMIKAVLSGKIHLAIMSIAVAASMMFASSLVLSEIKGDDPVHELDSLIGKQDIAAVQGALSRAGVADSLEGRYVLAQAMLVSKSLVPAVNIVKVANELAENPKFPPAAESLYAIEKAAFGKAHSRAAMAYEVTATRNQEWSFIGSGLFSLVGALVSIFAPAFFVLGTMLGRRVKSIRGLIGNG